MLIRTLLTLSLVAGLQTVAVAAPVPSINNWQAEVVCPLTSATNPKYGGELVVMRRLSGTDNNLGMIALLTFEKSDEGADSLIHKVYTNIPRSPKNAEFELSLNQEHGSVKVDGVKATKYTAQLLLSAGRMESNSVPSQLKAAGVNTDALTCFYY